jgi:hypothetical protein
MSFLKKLFGSRVTTPVEGPSEDYKGFRIRAAVIAVGGEHQVAGVIDKEIDGVIKRYEFLRADRMADRAEAERLALAKARRIVDEQGERMFETQPAG